MKKFSLRRGFTLIELLVVISIIGILITMGTVAFTTAQRKSRDAKRRSDVRAISNALEQYYADNNSSYPNGLNCPGLSPDYLPGGIPLDPKTGIALYCNGTGTTYCVAATLEDLGTGNCTSCTIGTGGDDVCIRNLQ